MNLQKYIDELEQIPLRFSNLAFWRGCRRFRDLVSGALMEVDLYAKTNPALEEHFLDITTHCGMYSDSYWNIGFFGNEPLYLDTLKFTEKTDYLTIPINEFPIDFYKAKELRVYVNIPSFSGYMERDLLFVYKLHEISTTSQTEVRFAVENYPRVVTRANVPTGTLISISRVELWYYRRK